MTEHDHLLDRVLCSPSARTRETLALVLSDQRNEPAIVFERNLYEASTDIFIDQIRQLGEAAPNLLIVGHNPAIENALGLICSGDSASLPEAFPTCALAVIDCAISSWDGIAAAVGVLEAFVRPRDLPIDPG